jgi:hypothetical protein
MEFVDMVMVSHTKFQMPTSDGLLVIYIKLKTKY